MDERRRLFCKAIVAGAAKQDAAVQAGYSPRTAPSMASQLLKKPEVKKEIERLRAERDEKIEADEALRLKDHYDTPLDMFMDIMNNPDLPFSVRYQAGKDALPYTNAKPAAKGKKNDVKDTAREIAGGGKFSPGSKPQLRSVG